MIKICHINSYYCSSKLYGLLVNALKKLGVESQVYCYLNEKSAINVEKEDFLHLRYPYSYYERFIFKIKHDKTYKDFKEYFKETNNVNFFHAHSLFSNGYIAYKASKEYNIPYIVAVRNTDINVFFKYMFMLRPMARKILNGASKIIFISEPYKEFCIDKYIKNKDEIKSKSIVIPNGINSIFLNNSKIKQRKDDCINLIYVGEISKNKNLVTTIKSCKILMQNGYKVKFVVIGKIKDQDIKLQLDESFIEYHEAMDQTKLLDFYSGSDIFVMPSQYETFGLVYAEAMTQGLPVIYTRNQGFDKQFKEGEVGFSVVYDNAEEISDKILKIYDNYDQISENCCKLSKKFDWDSIAKEYLNIYTQEKT